MFRQNKIVVIFQRPDVFLVLRKQKETRQESRNRQDKTAAKPRKQERQERFLKAEKPRKQGGQESQEHAHDSHRDKRIIGRI